MRLTTEEKTAIAQLLKEYCARYQSQNKAAESLKGISAATVSCIINGKWDRIADEMWLRLKAQLTLGNSWQLYRTRAYEALDYYLRDAKDYSNVIWVVGPAGIGKSTAAAAFERSNRNVFVLACSEDMHKSDFVHELASKLGVRTNGLTVRETLMQITRELVKMDSPLLVFDEGDKLTDSVLYYFISLYNALEDKCGMVFLSTNYICERMHRGVSKGRKGYDELDSRICRRFVPLDLVSADEVRAICEINGLTDRTAISKVVRDADECGNDLRRVKKCVHKELRSLGERAVE